MASEKQEKEPTVEWTTVDLPNESGEGESERVRLDLRYEILPNDNHTYVEWINSKNIRKRIRKVLLVFLPEIIYRTEQAKAPVLAMLSNNFEMEFRDKPDFVLDKIDFKIDARIPTEEDKITSTPTTKDYRITFYWITHAKIEQDREKLRANLRKAKYIMSKKRDPQKSPAWERYFQLHTQWPSQSPFSLDIPPNIKKQELILQPLLEQMRNGSNDGTNPMLSAAANKHSLLHIWTEYLDLCFQHE